MKTLKFVTFSPILLRCILQLILKGFCYREKFPITFTAQQIQESVENGKTDFGYKFFQISELLNFFDVFEGE